MPENVIKDIGVSFSNLLGGVFWIIILTIVAQKIMYRKIEKNPKSLGLLLLLSFLFWPLLPAYILSYKKYKNKVKNIYQNECMPILKQIEISPNETLINQFMELVEKYGIDNTPKSWNQIRGIWFVVNECPDIPTAKKTELRNFLMTKGLRLVGNDKNVIDNYKG